MLQVVNVYFMQFEFYFKFILRYKIYLSTYYNSNGTWYRYFGEDLKLIFSNSRTKAKAKHFLFYQIILFDLYIHIGINVSN